MNVVYQQVDMKSRPEHQNNNIQIRASYFFVFFCFRRVKNLLRTLRKELAPSPREADREAAGVKLRIFFRRPR